MLAEIPLVDIRSGTPLDLLKLFPGRAEALAKAAAGTFGLASRVASRFIFPFGDRVSRTWLLSTANPYREEIAEMERALGIDGVILLNVCFEWGCTSGVWQTEDGPLLRRVLDWPFPTLGESVVVALQSGPAGDFHNITWPGISGTFHAFAQGRFAAAINQAPMRRHGRGYLGDWAKNRVNVRGENGLPPAHLLRRTFETAPDYAAAKKALCETPVAVPAIFILSGVRTNEGCIIERTERDFGLREMEDGRVCATNHFVSRLNDSGQWMARPIDSPGRLKSARALNGGEDSFAWFVAPIANVNSRLAFEANAATGALRLIGTAGPLATTKVFELPQAA